MTSLTTNTSTTNSSRRTFLKATAIGSGGLMMTIALPGCATLKNSGMSQAGNLEQSMRVHVAPC